MKVENAFTSDILVPERLRPVDNRKIEALAKSMGAIGLQQPITVWHDGQDYHLVAGAHRLKAARNLGWGNIAVVVMRADEIDRQLWEIDENLMRSELTATQQAEHLAKRKELWEARQTAQVAPIESKRDDGKGHRPEGFASDTAKSTGVNKSTVNRAVARAEKVNEDIRDEIRGTDMDKGVVLDELARTEPSQQRQRLEELQEEKASPAETDARQLAALFKAWRKTPREMQEQFLDELRSEGRIE